MLPALTMIAVFIVTPMVRIAGKSIGAFDETPLSLSLEYYRVFWTTPEYSDAFIGALLNCLPLAAIIIPAQTILAFGVVALVSARSLQLPTAYISLIALPSFVGIAVIAGTTYYVFNASGALHNLATQLGYHEWGASFLYDPQTALLSLAVLICVAFFSHALLPLYSAAQSIPRPAIDAGFIARLNGFWRFVEIKFYYMRPVAIVSACFTLTSSLWLFDIHYALYAMAGTEAIRAKTDVLSTFILRLFFTYDGQSLSQMMIYVAITMLNIGILTLLSLAAALTPRSFQKKLVTWR